MNIAFFLHPKDEVEFLYDDYTLRQALEKMHAHSYTAIPVISREGKYICTVSEGDFLWNLQKDSNELGNYIDRRSTQGKMLQEVLQPGKNPPVNITASIEQLVNQALDQNFIPVVDDLYTFIGIVTRRDIIKYFCNKTK